MSRTQFLTYEQTAERFAGKSVAIVGSGPGCLDNDGKFIDSHDIIVRVNNYKQRDYEAKVGSRTDVFYSFFGGSIKKSADELKQDGVGLCMCKCPDAKFMESEWHRKRGMEAGVDFRKIYSRRAQWWFCDTYAPTLDRFMYQFNLLGKHVPTTGFSAILDVLSFGVSKAYITGFDFFRSMTHNVNERWASKNSDDPIRHMPESELAYVRAMKDPRVTFDKRLQAML